MYLMLQWDKFIWMYSSNILQPTKQATDTEVTGMPQKAFLKYRRTEHILYGD